MQPSILLLPHELILLITHRLPTADLNSLTRSCQHFYSILTPTLYKHGAQRCLTSTCCTSPLTRSMTSKHCHATAVVRLVQSGAPLTSSCPLPLHRAAMLGYTAALHAIRLALDIPLGSTTSDFGRSPMHYAAKYGQVQVLDYLVANGLDVNAVEGKGYTALHLAARGGRVEMVGRLLELGASVDAISAVNGRRPVHVAQDVDVARLLVRGGATFRDEEIEEVLEYERYERHRNWERLRMYFLGVDGTSTRYLDEMFWKDGEEEREREERKKKKKKEEEEEEEEERASVESTKEENGKVEVEN